MPDPGGISAGKISKPYGLQGQLHIILDPQTGNFIETDNPLFIDIDGQRVPFFVEEVDQVSFDQSIVKLEFINSIEEARLVSGCEVYLDLPEIAISQAKENDYFAVLGYEAYDKSQGYLGKVIEFVQNDFNSVLVVNHNDKELLIPAAEEFIIQVNHKEHSIHFQLPKGLTTL